MQYKFLGGHRGFAYVFFKPWQVAIHKVLWHFASCSGLDASGFGEVDGHADDGDSV